MVSIEGGPPTQSTFVNNTEIVYGGCAIGEDAQLLCQRIGRNLWRPCDILILQDNVDPYFQDYVAENGRSPEVIVPKGIDYGAISIMDGIDDEAFKAAIGRGRTVESYAVDHVLAQAVDEAGGDYFVKQPPEATSFANDKIKYASLMKGIIDVPDGVIAQGIGPIVEAVEHRLRIDGKAFVRHANSGGGLGNHLFDSTVLSVKSRGIRELIENSRPHIWKNGTALIEECLDLVWSPAIGFDRGQFAWNNLQITQGSKFAGCWSPAPEEIIALEESEEIGNASARALKELVGYEGPGCNDLGITRQGRQVGFEINARAASTTTAIEVGQLFFQEPWSKWRQSDHVIKALDHFALKQPMGFQALHFLLAREKLLATRDNPYGIVITMPPFGSTAGIQIQGKGYKQVRELYNRVSEAIGPPSGNEHDHPYLPS